MRSLVSCGDGWKGVDDGYGVSDWESYVKEKGLLVSGGSGLADIIRLDCEGRGEDIAEDRGVGLHAEAADGVDWEVFQDTGKS